jgi:CubicO group peptidase (beta-lactamase class C family)
MKNYYYFLLLWLFPSILKAQLYFPPNATTSSAWETVAPASLGWQQTPIDSLLLFAGASNTKAFIILKDGKIAIEKYYGTFTQDSLWYWASAGKSLTSTLIGIAQQDNLLAIEDTVSEHLGNGWTSSPLAKEKKITIKHLLAMTSGLKDNVADNNCSTSECLQYLTDAGTRWAYHTGAYRKLQNVITNSSGLSLQQFTNQKIRTPLGMGSGFWLDDVFYSKPRDMARFGLMSLAKGRWNNNVILSDTNYFRKMKLSSNPYNLSYGYLWWLNGQASFMTPGLQTVFPTALVGSAPADMYMALGKNDQKIYVLPSHNIVVVRMGNAATNSLLALSDFDYKLWKKIMDVLNSPTNIAANQPQAKVVLYPNPATETLTISNLPESLDAYQAEIYSAIGVKLGAYENTNRLSVSHLATGNYWIRVSSNGKPLYVLPFHKN